MENLGLIISIQNQTQKHVFLLQQTEEPYLPISVAGRGKECLEQSNWWNLRQREGVLQGVSRGWHSPNGLQAPLDGFRGNEARSSVVDLVGQAEAHLQPAVDV